MEKKISVSFFNKSNCVNRSYDINGVKHFLMHCYRKTINSCHTTLNIFPIQHTLSCHYLIDKVYVDQVLLGNPTRSNHNNEWNHMYSCTKIKNMLFVHLVLYCMFVVLQLMCQVIIFNVQHQQLTSEEMVVVSGCFYVIKVFLTLQQLSIKDLWHPRLCKCEKNKTATTNQSPDCEFKFFSFIFDLKHLGLAILITFIDHTERKH